MEETGMDFAECLKEAQSLGYAEKNPTDDIEGYDVKYKAALTAMKAFGAEPDLDAIITYGISTVSSKDLAWAKENGRSLKLLAEGKDNGDSISVWVMPVFLSRDNIFANVRGNFNATESDSKTLGKAVYIGQGAGSLPTAHAVVQDLLDIYVDQDSAPAEMQKRKVYNGNIDARFYIRTEKPELFEAVTEQKLTDDTLLTKVIPLSEADRMIKESGDAALFAAMVAGE